MQLVREQADPLAQRRSPRASAPVTIRDLARRRLDQRREDADERRLPAPLGPSRPTMSPERAVKEMRPSARRRPK
jgi:hypothetical protein